MASVTIKINPAATFYLTSKDPAARPVPFDLASLGITAGDTINLSQLGDFSRRVPDFPDSDTGMSGVFSATNRLLPYSQLHRVPDALDTGDDVVSESTFRDNLSTDIAEDFAIRPNTSVKVPNKARYLFVSALDTYYSDNRDPDVDFALSITAKADLRATAFGYAVPADQTHANNGPLPVNVPYIVRATVENVGPIRSEATNAGVYLSTDGFIDPARDFRIGTVAVPALDKGKRAALTINMGTAQTWPDTLPRWSGRVTIGLFIDPDHRLVDENTTNNANRGTGIDSRTVQLYDAVPANTTPFTGPTRAGALSWLLTNGFTPVPPFTGSGWSSHLPSSLDFISPFDGRTRSGRAYRQNAFLVYDVGARRWNVLVQGTRTLAEPSPETAALYGATWFAYVRDWHARF